MSYLNLIEIEFGAKASAANASAQADVTEQPRLIWAELNFIAFLGGACMAMGVFGSLAWMFVYC